MQRNANNFKDMLNTFLLTSVVKAHLGGTRAKRA